MVEATSPPAGWLDPALPGVQRAAALLAVMTVTQKIELALGNTFSPLLDGLLIPRQVCSDGPAGVRGGEDATAFPVPVAITATFDPSLARELGGAIAREVRAKGKTTWLGLCADIARTPLAGRCAETLGEDPTLAAAMAAAVASGAHAERVLVMVKHFVAYNQERWRIGHATGESERGRDDAINVVVSERALREIYVPAVAAALANGADAVMGSYNRVNGDYACQNAALLALLKDELGFRGFVAPDFRHAVRDALLAANAGLDRPTLDDDSPGDLTAMAFESGAVSPARLDDICRRVLFALVDSGLVDHPVPRVSTYPATSPAHRDLARKLAAASMVLLKNDGLLPLSGDGGGGVLALIGPGAENAIHVVGGSAAVTIPPERLTNPAAAIRDRAGGSIAVITAQGSLGDTPLPPIAGRFLGDPAGSGLTATYWADPWRQGAPMLTRHEATLELTTAPADLGHAWSARWIGTLHPPESGRYRISLLVSGGCELYLDSRLVLYGEREAARFIDGPELPLQAEVDLFAGRPTHLCVDYSTAPAVFPPCLVLGWQSPSQSLIKQAADTAGAADAAVVFVTSAQSEGMDRSTLALAGDQDRLIDAVARRNPRTAVVINSGGPVLMPWIDDVAAVLQVWYPGEQYGEALAAVLFGDVDPGGRLPLTFPSGDDQGPVAVGGARRYPGIDRTVSYEEDVLVGYRWFGATGEQPLFPFGHGLSYGKVEYSDERLDIDRDGSIVVSVELTNLSARNAVDVVQLYVEPPSALAIGGRVRQLKAFAKIELAAGERRRVSLELRRSELASYRPGFGWEVPPGQHTFWFGRSSQDVEVAGRVVVERPERLRSTRPES